MNPVFVALDTTDLDYARALAERLHGPCRRAEAGAGILLRPWPRRACALLPDLGLPIFLDLKFHDIPNTVAGAVRAAAGLGVAILNVHAAGGAAMLKAAARSRAQRQSPTPK